MKNPRTPAEWQEAVDAAEGALALESARMYKIVDGGPTVNVDRCEQILRQGARRGVRPAPEAIDRFALALIYQQARQAAEP